jgi:hypothetical protein
LAHASFSRAQETHGYTNLQEIQSLTFPGDANDHPTTPPPASATKSPVFEAIGTIAAVFVFVMAMVYRQRKDKQ